MNDQPTQSVILDAKQFEAEVEDLLRKSGVGLFEFKVQRLEKISAADGVYEIDVTARFEALGGDVLVLIECKHHTNPIKREVVQILYDKLRALGGHKGMIFSTARFQKGAIEFAQAHGIALVMVADGRTSYVTKSFGEPPPLPPWVPAYVGWIVSLTADGNESQRLITDGDQTNLLERFNGPAT
jgi:restriction system protein